MKKTWWDQGECGYDTGYRVNIRFYTSLYYYIFTLNLPGVNLQIGSLMLKNIILPHLEMLENLVTTPCGGPKIHSVDYFFRLILWGQ